MDEATLYLLRVCPAGRCGNCWSDDNEGPEVYRLRPPKEPIAPPGLTFSVAFSLSLSALLSVAISFCATAMYIWGLAGGVGFPFATLLKGNGCKEHTKRASTPTARNNVQKS